MKIKNKTDPWHSYCREYLAPRVEALAKHGSFVEFQRRLAEVLEKFLGYCRGKHAGIAIDQLQSAVDVELFLQFPTLIAIARAAQRPWGWRILCNEMAKRKHGVRNRKTRKRRPVSKQTARGFITNWECFAENAEGNLLEKTDERVKAWRRDPSLQSPDSVGYIFTAEETCKLLDHSRLPVRVGEGIVRAYQELRSQIGKKPSKLKREAREREARIAAKRERYCFTKPSR